MSRQIIYPGGDGITRISDPFWMNHCKKCGNSFWSCLCTADCPECGSQELIRTLGDIPYEQIITERGEPVKQKSE